MSYVKYENSFRRTNVFIHLEKCFPCVASFPCNGDHVTRLTQPRFHAELAYILQKMPWRPSVQVIKLPRSVFMFLRHPLTHLDRWHVFFTKCPRDYQCCQTNTTSGCDSFCRAFENFCGQQRIEALYISICKSKEFLHFSFPVKLDALFGL